MRELFTSVYRPSAGVNISKSHVGRVKARSVSTCPGAPIAFRSRRGRESPHAWSPRGRIDHFRRTILNDLDMIVVEVEPEVEG